LVANRRKLIVNTTLLLLNEPQSNTAWAVSTLEQLNPEGSIYSVFPYLGQKKISTTRVKDISLPFYRRENISSYFYKFLQVIKLRNSAIKIEKSMEILGNLSYIQRRLSKVIDKSESISIISDYSYDHPSSEVIQELLNLFDYFCQNRKTIPITIYCKKGSYSESEDYADFWKEHTFTVGQRRILLVTRPNWVNCGTDTHSRNLLRQFAKNNLAYVQMLISPSTSSFQKINPYIRTGNFAKLNDFVHVLTRFQLIKIAFTLFFNSKIERSVVLTHELIYSMSRPNRKVRRILEEKRPDIFYVSHFFNIKRIIKMKRDFGKNIRVICDTHDIQSFNYEQQGYRQYLRRRVANYKSEIKAECEILSQCDHLIFLSESEQEFFIRNAGSPIPTTLFTPPIEVIKRPAERKSRGSYREGTPKKVLVVMSNNSGNQRGLDWFTKEVVPLIPELDIRIVGGILSYAETKPEVSRNKNVIFTGVVPDLSEEYSQADVVAIPVVIGAGIAIKTLEALAYDKPIVASLPGFRGVKSALVKNFTAETPEEFASKLREICDSPAKGKANQRYARQLQKEISPRMNFNRILQLFEGDIS